MLNQLYQIFQPFATLFFYRQFVKKDLVKQELRDHPGMRVEEAEARVEERIRNNQVRELDPAGPLRPTVEKIKADPSSIFEVLGGWIQKAAWTFLAFFLLLLAILKLVED